MGWDAGEGMGWWMLVGGLFWIVLWGAVIYLIATFVRSPGRSAHPAQDDAIGILKRRYARGEIGRDEYERMRRDLAA
jgi:putative membrane protein